MPGILGVAPPRRSGPLFGFISRFRVQVAAAGRKKAIDTFTYTCSVNISLRQRPPADDVYTYSLYFLSSSVRAAPCMEQA